MDFVDLIQQKKLGHVVDEIQNVIDAFGQFVDIFPIEWRDKRKIQFFENSVREFIANVFEPLDLIASRDQFSARVDFGEAHVKVSGFFEVIRSLFEVA